MELRLPPAGYEFHGGAKERYVEHFGSLVVMNTYLKIALASVSLVALGLVYLNMRTNQALRSVKPLVIRVDEVGRAAAITYPPVEYRPQAPELKYFLIRFVTDYYGRIRATIRENYARSLYFLDARLADATMEANKKSKAIEQFLADPREEIDIRVKNVTLEDLREPPYRATVDYERIYYTPSTRAEIRRESCVGQFVFIIRDRVPNAAVPVNPLGLTITYFREDQAFVTEAEHAR